MNNKQISICAFSLALGLGGLSQNNRAFAQVIDPSLNLDSLQNNPLEQVTDVSGLKDVSPADWAYEALRSLVDRYGCIAGFPDRSYRGNRSLSRYEFAAGLNSCLSQIERLIASSNEVIAEDIAVITRLKSEFATELTNLATKVTKLESFVSSLEDDQFSTTTKLKGEIAFALSSAFGDLQAVPAGVSTDTAPDLADQVVFNNRVMLNFNTSFTGKDLLKLRLDSTNLERFNNATTGTNMTRLAFDPPLGGNVRIGKLFYRFRPAKNLRLTVDGTRGNYNANLSNFHRFFASPIKGSISNFGRFNPIYAQGIGGGGITANYKINDALVVNAGYLARNADNPTAENGLFDGSFAALAQLDVKPTDSLKVGLTYVRAYYPDGRAFVSAGTGSRLANAPFGNIDTGANHFGLQASWDLEPVTISGWAGYSIAEAEGSTGVVNAGDQADIFNWAVSLAFPDLGGQGNLLGLIVGQQPRVIDSDTGNDEADSNWHLQAQYTYRLQDSIGLNLGVLAILNPENNADNDTIYVGTLKTIFEF